VVIDLGSGAGNDCFIARSQTGESGKVIGIDFTEAMIAKARANAEKLGYNNVEFRQGDIEQMPVAAATADVIVSNCVLNLVRPTDKRQLFEEMFRVLKVGGRCVISDIVCDEDVPQEMQDDPELWSGCVSGAFREDAFLKMFENAGFYGMHVIERTEQPWQTIKGIEFRSVTVAAYKGKQGPCHEHYQSVIYKGPWRKVIDDDGHTLERGQRMAVCDKTFRLYKRQPYADQFYFVEPLTAVKPEEAKLFDCRRNAIRNPKETKGQDYDATTEASSCCGTDGCC